MTLRKKRNLKVSTEPKAKRDKTTSQELHFSVQKHAATHLHYDFRLEYKGVLLSWAIPKEPLGCEKRLAIRVEDHPLEYLLFQGVIPKGSYGAGTVEIWDEGTYTIGDLNDRSQIEMKIAIGLEQGKLVFTLHGHKLQGDYVLVKMKDNQWLFFKKKEEKE